MRKAILEVKSNDKIADKIFKLKLIGTSNKKEFTDFKPGKFIHIKCSDNIHPLLRRPMSICNITDDNEEMTVLYRSEGDGTKLLSEKRSGDSLDILAPLGLEFDYSFIKAGDKVTLVGGGIGVPPLYYLGRKLVEKGAIVKSILGFNSKKDVFYEKEFSELGEVTITTIDGTHGQKGLVTDVLDLEFDTLYSCGPTPMLKALQRDIPKEKNAFMSLEERMGCGIGACLACVCKPAPDYKSESGYVRACTEGPVFKLHDVEL